MARAMRPSRAALDRLLDPKNESVTLRTMARAARGARQAFALRPCVSADRPDFQVTESLCRARREMRLENSMRRFALPRC